MWLWWGSVQNASPHEAASKVDDGLDVLLICLNVGSDQALLFGDTPLLRLAIDGREALVATRLLAALN